MFKNDMFQIAAVVLLAAVSSAVPIDLGSYGHSQSYVSLGHAPVVAHAPALSIAHAPVAVAHAPVLAHAEPIVSTENIVIILCCLPRNIYTI